MALSKHQMFVPAFSHKCTTNCIRYVDKTLPLPLSVVSCGSKCQRLYYLCLNQHATAAPKVSTPVIIIASVNMSDSEPPLLDDDLEKEDEEETTGRRRRKPAGMSALLAASAFKTAGASKGKKAKEVSISERRLSMENVTLAAGAAKKIQKRNEEKKETTSKDTGGLKSMMAKLGQKTEEEKADAGADDKRGLKGMMATLAAGKAGEPQVGAEKEKAKDEKSGIKGMMASLAAANAKAEQDASNAKTRGEQLEAGSSVEPSLESEVVPGEEVEGEVKKEHSVLLNLIRKKQARKPELQNDTNKSFKPIFTQGKELNMQSLRHLYLLFVKINRTCLRSKNA